MRIDCMERTEQTIYLVNSTAFLPHYRLVYFVGPGYTKQTPIKLWSVRELEQIGAVKSSAFLWPRHTFINQGATA